MSPGRVVAAGALATCAALLAGCGVVPAAAPRQVGPTTTRTATAAPGRPNPAGPTGGAPSVATTAPVPGGFTRLERAAVRVRNVGCDGVATGSGFAIGPHAFVTNRHVVGDTIELEAEAYDGRDVEVSTAGAAVVADLAIVRTVDRLPVHLRLARHRAAVGDRVTAVGYPLGGPLTTTRGSVLGYRTDPLGESATQALVSDAHVEHGSSGSALVDRAGDVVGVVYAGGRGSSAAVPVDVLRTVLADPDASSQPVSCAAATEDPATTAGGTPPSGTTSCGPGVSVGPVTSCAFALEVEAAWAGAGGGSRDVSAYSPVTRRWYRMHCTEGTPTVCRGGHDATVYLTG